MSNALVAIAIARDLIGLVQRANEALDQIQQTQMTAMIEGRDISDAELDAQKALRLKVLQNLDDEIARRTSNES